MSYYKGLNHLWIEVIFVATNKEDSKETTYDIAQKCVKKYNIEDKCKVILYPEKIGVMAHQINYALKQLDDERIVFVYNVDSKVSKDTIDYVITNKAKLKNGVFQQYSYAKYCKNNKLMLSAIRWQNRWSIGYEMPRTLLNKILLKFKFNYIIGHGMVFINKNILKVGGYPEDEINEDNVLGYKLNKENISIYPIPTLEQVGFASKTSIYIQQQSVWYNGPLYAFQYFLKILGSCCGLREKLRMFFVACLNFKNALNWNFFAIMTVISMIGSIVLKKYYYLIILCICLFLYVYVVNSYSEKVLIKNGYIHKKERLSIIYTLVEIFFWLIIHSTGPMLTLVKIFINKNKQSNKYKTEK